MLSVMTYNAYINIAIVLGGGFGYWIFGPKLIEFNVKQFYERQRLWDCDKECAGKVSSASGHGFYGCNKINNFLDNLASHQGHGSTVSIVAEQLVTEATVEVHMPIEA